MSETPLRFDHLAFPVYDAAGTYQFYSEVLQQLAPVTQHSIYFSDPNGIVLEVTTASSAPVSQADARAAERVQRWITARSRDGAAAARG